MKRLAPVVVALLLALTAAPAAGNAAAPSWTTSAVIYEVNVRQYTQEGTFKAFQEHLPRLKALGVDILWLMPIHPISVKERKGSLGSPYAVADYKKVNPAYGTDSDFKALVTAAHAQGMKVVLDWVANHTGWDNPWIANPTWYTRDSKGNIVCPPGTDWTDVADLDFSNSDMRRAMVDAMAYWVRQFDIDGFRADVAAGVPVDFWNEANQQLQAIKPLFMLAEDDSIQDLLRSAFVANYNWKLKDFVNHVGANAGTEGEFAQLLARLRTWYPNGSYAMNFITNHDENSWNGTEFDRLGPAVKEMAALTFVLPGMPLIYSGQEIGLNRKLLFFEKDPITWTSSSWTGFYAKLISLKHKNPALWNGTAGGTTGELAASDSSVIAMYRRKGSDTVVYVANMSGAKVTSKVGVGTRAGSFVRYSDGKKVSLPKVFTTTLKPWSWEIYSTISA